MRPRIQQELTLLCQRYGDTQHVEVAGEDWFMLPNYRISAGWRLGDDEAILVPLTFLVKVDYPGSPPYGFFAPAGLTFAGSPPKNAEKPPVPPPFPGEWLHFSWTGEIWAPTADVRKGSNLVAWCRSFVERFKEGV